MKKYEYATIHIHFDSDEEGKAGTYRFFLNDIGARGYQVIENKSNGGKQMVYMLMREVNQE